MALGGLVISQDGRVIYRSFEPPSGAAENQPRGRPGASLLHRVNPEYPPAALAQHGQGRVILDVKVLANGSISDVLVRSGHPLLTESAVKAIRQWQFQPTEDAGNGERQTQVTIRFTLPAN